MKRVLIIHKGRIMTDGVESLLEGELDLSVSSTTHVNGTNLVEEIQHLNPDIVVMGDGLHSADICTLLELLTCFPYLRVMVVDDKDNLVHIFDKQELVITQSTDFVSAIRHD